MGNVEDPENSSSSLTFGLSFGGNNAAGSGQPLCTWSSASCPQSLLTARWGSQNRPEKCIRYWGQQTASQEGNYSLTESVFSCWLYFQEDQQGSVLKAGHSIHSLWTSRRAEPALGTPGALLLLPASPFLFFTWPSNWRVHSHTWRDLGMQLLPYSGVTSWLGFWARSWELVELAGGFLSQQFCKRRQWLPNMQNAAQQQSLQREHQQHKLCSPRSWCWTLGSQGARAEIVLCTADTLLSEFTHSPEFLSPFHFHCHQKAWSLLPPPLHHPHPLQTRMPAVLCHLHCLLYLRKELKLGRKKDTVMPLSVQPGGICSWVHRTCERKAAASGAQLILHILIESDQAQSNLSPHSRKDSRTAAELQCCASSPASFWPNSLGCYCFMILWSNITKK